MTIKVKHHKLVEQVPRFSCIEPCPNCPYLKTSPVQHWAKLEFRKLLKSESGFMGETYSCHKQNGSICVGFLIDQLNRDVPSLKLRLDLSRNCVPESYFKTLESYQITNQANLYGSLEDMIRANYPDLLKNYKPKSQENKLKEILRTRGVKL